MKADTTRALALDINKLEASGWRAIEQSVAMMGKMVEARKSLPRDRQMEAADAMSNATAAANRFADGVTLLGTCHRQMLDIAEVEGLTHMLGDVCPFDTASETPHLRVVA